MKWTMDKGGDTSLSIAFDDSGAAMKNEWKTKPFEDCIEKVTYTRKIQRKDFLTDGAYPVVSQEEDFINGYWDNEADLFKVTTPIIVFGDHTKILKFVDFDFVLGADGVKILQPREYLLPKFFYYQLHTARLDSLGYARHYKLLKELEIAYPTPAEQRRIVGILDEAFACIATAKAKAEKNLQNARALFESHLNTVFTQRGDGWADTTLDECFRLKSGDGLTSKAMNPGAYPVFGGNGIAGMHDDFNLSGDNVIIGRVGALCGNARHITENIWLTDNAFKIVDFSYEFDRAFLTYLLNYKNLRSLARQAAQPVISNSSLKDLVLNFPGLSEQQRITIQLDDLTTETERLESIYQRKLAALDELKKSLLHQAFSGKL